MLLSVEEVDNAEVKSDNRCVHVDNMKVKVKLARGRWGTFLALHLRVRQASRSASRLSQGPI